MSIAEGACSLQLPGTFGNHFGLQTEQGKESFLENVISHRLTVTLWPWAWYWVGPPFAAETALNRQATDPARPLIVCCGIWHQAVSRKSFTFHLLQSGAFMACSWDPEDSEAISTPLTYCAPQCYSRTVFTVWRGALSCFKRPLPSGNTVSMKGCASSATMFRQCQSNFHVNGRTRRLPSRTWPKAPHWPCQPPFFPSYALVPHLPQVTDTHRPDHLQNCPRFFHSSVAQIWCLLAHCGASQQGTHEHEDLTATPCVFWHLSIRTGINFFTSLSYANSLIGSENTCHPLHSTRINEPWLPMTLSPVHQFSFGAPAFVDPDHGRPTTCHWNHSSLCLSAVIMFRLIVVYYGWFSFFFLKLFLLYIICRTSLKHL